MPIPPCASEGYVTQGQYKAERSPGQARTGDQVHKGPALLPRCCWKIHCDERSEEAIPRGRIPGTPACCGAARSTTIRGACVVPTVTSMVRHAGTGPTGFGCASRHGRIRLCPESTVETYNLVSTVITTRDDPNASNQEHASARGGKGTNGAPKLA